MDLNYLITHICRSLNPFIDHIKTLINILLAITILAAILALVSYFISMGDSSAYPAVYDAYPHI